MGKNIVVFSDGTGQEGGKGQSTNVYRLYELVENGTSRQLAFYDAGLGTDWRKITGLGTGFGISQNICECYRFISDHYEAGDKIFLFGFSRGAYTVRSLSGFLQLCGLLPKDSQKLIGKAYSIYKTKNLEKRERKLKRFKAERVTRDVDIEMIGVWDTVGALGLPIKWLDYLNPFPHKFHDTSMVEIVRAGYHALSIDDERLTFHPTFWDERQKKAQQKVEQVFFPGVHTDVGGGYQERGLSNMSLNWMIQCALAEGLVLRDSEPTSFPEDPNEKMNDSRACLGKIYRRKVRHLNSGEVILPPKVHASVCQRENYNPWIHQHHVCD